MMSDPETVPILDTGQDNEVVVQAGRYDVASNGSSYFGDIMRFSLNSLVHMLLGVNITVCLWFGIKSWPLGPFEQHIVLCVTGYQLLMAQGLLSLNRYNGWSATMIPLHKKRAHWILGLSGATLAITGTSIMINNKKVHFNSLHGKLGLAALIFTCMSMVNGLTSLYATELRRFIPPPLSKLSHIILGVMTFALSTSCLCAGLRKKSFISWSSNEMSYLMVGIISTYSFVILSMPVLKFIRKLTSRLGTIECSL